MDHSINEYISGTHPNSLKTSDIIIIKNFRFPNRHIVIKLKALSWTLSLHWFNEASGDIGITAGGTLPGGPTVDALVKSLFFLARRTPVSSKSSRIAHIRKATSSGRESPKTSQCKNK